MESTEQRLNRYLDLLLDENRRVNLTAATSRSDAWARHVLDSLSLLPLLSELPAGARVIDVGSGGGLPGIPLAISRGDLRMTLLEATLKKAMFLQRCATELGLGQTRVVAARAEDAAHRDEHRERYDVATCRAVGSLREVLEYTLPFLKEGGRLLAMKGKKGRDEIEAATAALATLGGGSAELFQTDQPAGVIVAVKKLRPTPDDYPRPPGRARKRPL